MYLQDMKDKNISAHNAQIICGFSYHEAMSQDKCAHLAPICCTLRKDIHLPPMECYYQKD